MKGKVKKKSLSAKVQTPISYFASLEMKMGKEINFLEKTEKTGKLIGRK